MQEIGIESSVLENIRHGRKTIEGRLGKPKFLKLDVGDILHLREDIWDEGVIIASRLSNLKIRITQILYFETFAEMMDSLDHEAAIPDAKTPEEAAAAYRKYYSAEDEQEYGVVAILFELI
jgi:ASC-1-like (ASCH) protein